MKKTTIAGIEVFLEESERYIQVNDADENAMNALREELDRDYPAYTLVFCYHNTEPPAACLESVHAVLADDCVELRLFPENLTAHTGIIPERVSEARFAEFAAFHDRHNPDLYWTSRRIARDLSRWGIFTVRTDGRLAGYIVLAVWDPLQAEIFCLFARTAAQKEALLRTAAAYAFGLGIPQVLLMADTLADHEEAASAAGFRPTGGFYKGYIREGIEEGPVPYDE
ncbi:MAG: hypothetical protein FWG93_04310 [Oscillospiraceae bacterium]|nr:hypothetical protein [Oscillospiraceae bacterium]